ncbi:MAG TPA: orotidine-5'-phosphate decarboxylase [Bdellovibrionota bacterium]|nr:orotidine-5'-phosphate decarboxylase [Bdellovibrionota bacterium]
MTSTQLMVALDYPAVEPAWRLVQALGDLPVTYKVGSELFLAAGPQWVERLVGLGRPVFLDLKWHDIPRTVAASVRLAAELGVRYATLHLGGGRQMVEAAVHEAQTRSGGKLTLLGVSVLTSLADADWAEVMDAAAPVPGKSAAVEGLVARSVEGWVKAGAAWGIPGIVCSAHEVKQVSKKHPKLFTVVPGIRPAGSAAGDQARVKTPREARAEGAKAIVVGRPISESDRPKDVALQILRDLTEE